MPMSVQMMKRLEDTVLVVSATVMESYSTVLNQGFQCSDLHVRNLTGHGEDKWNGREIGWHPGKLRKPWQRSRQELLGSELGK